VVVMLGTVTWTDAVDEHPGYVQFASRLRAVMPLIAIAITPLLIAIQFLSDLPAPIEVLNRAAVALILVSVAVRQSVLLKDRERAVAREQGLGRDLSATEAKYRALVERQPGVVYLAEPGKHGRWHYVSPQIEPMLGFPAQAWLDDPTLWARQIHADDRELILGHEGQLTTGRPEGLVQREYRMCAADGREIWVLDEEMVTQTDDDGTPNLVQGVLVDISQRKRAEQELQALTVEGTAGGGAVKAVVTGKQEVVSVTISPDVVDPDDVEMLQDLVLAAVSDALTKARVAGEQRMARVTGGLKIPGF